MISFRHLLLCGFAGAAMPVAPLRGADAPAGARPADAGLSSPASITTVAEAVARWPELTTDDQPVELEGVVIGAMPTGSFRVHDGKLGLFVSRAKDLPRVTDGERVRVTGILRPGGFSPWIRPLEVTRLGHAPFPAVSRLASFGLLASGAVDSQWVEIEGVVRAVSVPEPRDFAVLDLGMAGGSLNVLVRYNAHDDYAPLVDAVVRIRGVAAVNVNAQKQLLAPSFRVPSLAEITVLRPGQPDAFAQPLVPLDRILRVLPGIQEHPRRVHTSGVVTRQLTETMVFVRAGEAGLKVESAAPGIFQPGEQLDLAGFPVVKNGMAVLEQAQMRRMSPGAAPGPIVLPHLDKLLAGKHSSDLVRVRARLVDWVHAGSDVTLFFQAGNQLFKGLLKLPAGGPLVLPERNSLVDVTGICVLGELKDVWFYQPLSFVLLVAGPGDVALVEAPPWWTPARLWRALALACAVLLAAVGWGWALRRQIVRTRAVIEHQARRAAALEERGRIARDLHDTLEQGLTGLSLQMKAIETDLEQGTGTARERLQAARQMLRQNRALARNAIRELRSNADPAQPEGLAAGLHRLAENWNRFGAVVRVQLHGAPRELPARTEIHLLGIATEAVTNAVKHGQAARIQIDVETTDEVLALCIADNGTGFDAARPCESPGRGFGLLGMRERMQELKGELCIASQPGQGTRVTARMLLGAGGAMANRARLHRPPTQSAAAGLAQPA